MSGDKIFKSSAQQEEMWVNAINTSFSYWNFLVSKSFKGKLDPKVFRGSLDALIRRHSGLRTGFLQSGSTVYQHIQDSFDVNEILEIETCTPLNKREFDACILQRTKEMLQHQFQPDCGLLFRVNAFCYGETVYIVTLFNHLICDYISTQIFWNDLFYVYNCLLDQIPINFKACLQYHEYSEYQDKFLTTEDFQTKKAYWDKKIGQPLPPLKLPFGNHSTSLCLIGKEIAIPSSLMSDLRSVALKKRVIFSAIFQLAYYIVLKSYSGKETIGILNIFHSRGVGSKRNNDTIGLFADTLLNTITLNDECTLQALLQQVNSELKNSIANSDVPYKEVFKTYQNKFQHHPDTVQADFNMLKMNPMRGNPQGLIEYKLEDKAIATKFDTSRDSYRTLLKAARSSLDIQSDISLTIKDDPAGSKIRVTILCGRDEEWVCDDILESYKTVLTKIAYHLDSSLKDIDIKSNVSQRLHIKD